MRASSPFSLVSLTMGDLAGLLVSNGHLLEIVHRFVTLLSDVLFHVKCLQNCPDRFNWSTPDIEFACHHIGNKTGAVFTDKVDLALSTFLCAGDISRRLVYSFNDRRLLREWRNWNVGVS